MKFLISAIIVIATSFFATGGNPVKDVPIPSNQSIIIFSATSGGEGGRVRQNISFTSDTALTLTGGVENDYVRITPFGSTFTAVAKFHKAFGETTFTATATTAGNAEIGIEGMTVPFTFRVLVVGVDFPHLVQSFFEFPVGATVAASLNVFFAAAQMQLNIPKVQSPIVSSTYGTTHMETDSGRGNLAYTVWDGEPSGISLDPILDAENYVRGATLTGVALRPGIYYRVFGISSYDAGGTDPFPGATGYGILTINVYDDRESPKIIVPHEHTADPDFVRVIRHSIEGYAASRLTGEFTRSGDVWTRRIEETVSATVSDIWEYQISASADVWTLSGREYLSDETVPDYSTLATASGRFGEVPPNMGWSGGVLCAGDSAFFVEGNGFFDWKGARTIENFTGDVYEQQPVVAAQYAGWTNPPATQYASGLYLAPDPAGTWRISADPAAVNGTEVKKQTIKHAAFPYHPPVAAPAIGGVTYRDAALLIPRSGLSPVAVNAHLPHVTGGLEFRTGNRVAAVPAHYTWLRQLPPPLVAGIPKQITVHIVSESSSRPDEAYSNQYVCQRGLTQGTSYGTAYEFKNWNNENGEKRITQTFSASIDADSWMRSAPDLLMGLMGVLTSDSSSMSYHADEHNTRTYGQSNWQAGWAGPNGQEYYSRDLMGEAPIAPGTQSGRVLMVLGSGRNESDAAVRLYAAGMADAAGSMQTSADRSSYGTETDFYTDGTSSTTVTNNSSSTDGPYTRSMAAGMVSPACHVVSMSDLIFSGITVTTFTGSFEGRLETSSSYTDEEGVQHSTSHVTTITATHERTEYAGENLPAGVIGRGWTHLVKIIDGITHDTWHDDPDGAIYEGEYVDYGEGFDYDALDMPFSGNPRSAGRLAWRNESWTKTVASFSTTA